MKVYTFTDSGVLVDGQPLKLRRRGNEPVHAPSPDRVGFSILLDCVGRHSAFLYSHEFQKEIVDYCQIGEKIFSEEVQEWNDFKCQIDASVQFAVWSLEIAEPPPVGQPLRLPRLLRRIRKSGK